MSTISTRVSTRPSPLASIARLALLAGTVLLSFACAVEENGEHSSGLRILPRTARAQETLHAAGLALAAAPGSSPADPIADDETLRWLINGHPVATGVQLDGGSFHRGDIIELQRVRRVAGAQLQVLERDQLVIRNSPPRIESARIVRSRENGLYLQCEVQCTDADDDPLQLRFEWTVAGQELAGALSEMAALHEVAKGSLVSVRVFASDGELESEPFQPKPYLIDNLPPRLRVSPDPRLLTAGKNRRRVIFEILSEDPEGDELRIELEGAPKDARYDPRTRTVSWLVEGPIVATRVKLRATDSRGAAVEQWLRLSPEIGSSH